MLNLLYKEVEIRKLSVIKLAEFRHCFGICLFLAYVASSL